MVIFFASGRATRSIEITEHSCDLPYSESPELQRRQIPLSGYSDGFVLDDFVPLLSGSQIAAIPARAKELALFPRYW
jgi:hypothetical protein